MLFKNYSQQYYPDADDLFRYFNDFAKHFNIKVQYNTLVTQVSKKDGKFVVTDQEGHVHTGKRLVIATGLSKMWLPDIPGIELCDTYVNHSLDLEDYTNKRVLIVGKGNSAFETANHLEQSAAVIHLCSPESTKFAWQSHYVGHLRAVNNRFLDTYQLKAQNAVIDASIQKIEKHNGKFQVHITYSHAQGQTAVLTYDKAIACTGFMFDPSFFDESCRPELAVADRFPAQTSEWESTNVPDMYIIGILMHACDYKKTMSAFIHGFRHNVRALSRLFEQKYHNTPWPSQELKATPQSILGKIVERITTDPAMFLQPGFLGDVVVVSDENGTAKYYDEIRTDYIPDSPFSKNDHYYTISLEYGHFRGDPFSVERDPNPDKGMDAPYLHPVIRRYKQGMLVTEHHIQDDLENAWYKDIYTQPALAFFEKQLKK
jgi:thioredoxin reductase